MTLEQSIGQKFMAGFIGTKVSQDLRNLIESYHIGNVILFQRNIENEEQLTCLCEEIQELVQHSTGHKAWIAIDQEGGTVTRLPSRMINVPGQMAAAATRDPSNAYQLARITAEQLRKTGINFNLAPVLDINSNKDNPVIGVRSFSDSPQIVSDYGRQMIAGFTDGGILCCGKHFPGHGDTSVDSHLGLPLIEKTKEELLSFEIIPFIDSIRAGLPAIMTSHILFPALESRRVPATMSRNIITGILRNELKFTGIVLSDCMEMDAVKRYYGTGYGVLEAFRAGVDVAIVSHSASLVSTSIGMIKEALKDGSLCETEFKESAERILRQKETVSSIHKLEQFCGEAAKKKSDQIRRNSITLVAGTVIGLGPHPVFIGSLNYRVNNAMELDSKAAFFAEYMVKCLGGTGITTSADPTEKEITRVLDLLPPASSIIFATFNGHTKKGQLKLGKRLEQLNIPMIAIALRDPYDLSAFEHTQASIAAWDYSEDTLLALVQVLNGTMECKGKLPVKIK